SSDLGIGLFAARSSLMRTSTRSIAPQVRPSANRAHSNSGTLALLRTMVGTALPFNAEAMMRRPNEPVSTNMSGMVWHWLLLPGVQMVTLVSNKFTLLVGPPVTAIGCSLSLPPVDRLDPPPPPPPPHADNNRTTPAAAKGSHSLLGKNLSQRIDGYSGRKQ